MPLPCVEDEHDGSGEQTGTANRQNGHGYSGYTSSFVGFGPADKPQLLVEVVLQNPRSGHFGGLVAAPVFRQVCSTW